MSALRYSNEPQADGAGEEGAKSERQSSGSGLEGDVDGDEYALDDKEEDVLDDDGEEYEEDEDEDEDDEEEEEEEEEEEPPVSQYISALDLAGM